MNLLSAVDFVFPCRRYVLAHAVMLVVGVVACFIPLFNIVGYESAALFGVLAGVASFALTVSQYGPGRLAHPYVDEVSPLDRFAAHVARGWSLLTAPFLALVLNSLRVENCDPATGLAFWLAIPVMSVVVGATLGMGVATLVWGRRYASRAAVVLVFIATVFDFGLRLALEPPIIGYHAFLGYFSGSIYDEALAVPSGLVAYRIIHLLGVSAVLLWLRARWSSQHQAEHGVSQRWFVAAVVVSLAWAGMFAERQRWNIDLDSEEVAERLGGRVESEHFVIFYPTRPRFDADEVARMVEDHEFRYAEMQAFFGTDPVALHGEKVRSFVYADRPQKGELIGARRTLVAKIWLGEMHILWRHYGDHMLAHELAHVFTEPFASGPLRLSTRWGVGINMGLVEGAATAADWHSGEMTPHESSAALIRMDRAPDLRRLVGASGFWTQSSGRAYTLVGSFIRYLVDTRGIEPFRKAYPHGEFEAAYGVGVDELVAEWEGFLGQVELTPAQMERARFLYDRPTIFEKVCARTIGELRVEAGDLLAAGQVAGVTDTYREILGYAPLNVSYRLEFAQSLMILQAFDEARAEVQHLLERADLTPAQRAQVLHVLGDIAWAEGRRADAQTAYEEALSRGLPVEFERLIGAKLRAVRRPARPSALALNYLVSRADKSEALYYPVTWRGEYPDDPLAAYLVGRRLWAEHQHTEALAHLEFADGRLDGPLGHENTRMLAMSYYWLGRDADARAGFARLLESGRTAYAVEATEWMERIEWRARNRLQGRGG